MSVSIGKKERRRKLRITVKEAKTSPVLHVLLGKKVNIIFVLVLFKSDQLDMEASNAQEITMSG